MITKDQVKQFTFGIKVRGAYVQQPESARLIGIDAHRSIASVDASSLYPSIMILSNISEETLVARLYDLEIVGKFFDLLKQALQADANTKTQIKHVFADALQQQFQMFVKKEKPAKQKETLQINVEYYSRIFNTIIDSGYSFDQICEPVDDRSYYLLKSYLHPLLEALTWTSPYNRGYNNTLVKRAYFPEAYEKVKGAWILDNIYSTRTKLIFLDKKALDEYLDRYLLNPFGTIFYRHKTKLAQDVHFLMQALDMRSHIKSEMIVLGQLITNIENGNEDALTFAKYLMNQEFDRIDQDLIEKAGLAKILREKKIDDISSLQIVINDDIIKSVETTIFFKNLKQLAAKIFANTSFGIKGLLTFQFAAPILGNSITTGGKIYGIKLAQAAAAHVLDKHNRTPTQ